MTTAVQLDLFRQPTGALDAVPKGLPGLPGPPLRALPGKSAER